MNKREQIQQEAIETASKYKRCGLAISMGVGKTLIGLRHLEQLLEKEEMTTALVVAPKVSIFESWKDDAVKFEINPLVMNGVYFSTYLSLSKHDLNDYDVIILDECHSLLDTHNEALSTYTGKILGLTGTPPRHRNSEKGQMVERYCPIVYRYITDEAVGDKILNDYKIHVHYLPLETSKTLRVENKGRVWYTSEKDSYEYWSRRVNEAKTVKEKQIMSVMRMKAMMDFVSKEQYTKFLLETMKDKCIIFANTIAQARRLCFYTYDSENSSSEENLQMFKEGKLRRLSCVLQLNEGINVPDLKAGIILHSYGNERKSSQRIGRLLRLNPDDCATVHVLCYKDTIDEKWVNQALSDFDPTKIEHLKNFQQTLNF